MTTDIQDVYNELPIGVCVLRRDRKNMDILYANPEMLSIIERDGQYLSEGEKLPDIWPHKDAKTLITQLKSPTPPDSFVLPLPGRDGQRWIQLNIAQGTWNDIPCHILLATDISANKEAEQRLQVELERADALADMKSNFLATMSHEIRTPMQTIYGLLELISDEVPDDKIQSMLKIAKTSSSGLLEILDDVLDLAKMDANKMELDVFEVPVRMLVRGTLEALGVKVHGSRVELIDDIQPDVPFVVIGDPKRLRQIIMNLAGNAVKFTEKGSVTVRVSTQTQSIRSPKKGVALRFEVIDTGIGMSQDVCDKLFNSFTQADNTTSRKYGGTGLGLSICKKLVDLMGGKIGVTSKPGKGSTFWFEIPTEEVGTETTTIDLPSLDGISILSVEDHPQGGKEIVNSLRSMGATVELCTTYQEGLELIKRRPFDVGVIDQGLPDGLGLDLIKDIMQIRPFMGFIMYTVRDDIGLQHSLQALGAQYLSKPASRAGLGEAVKNAAAKSRQVSTIGSTRLLIAEDTESVRFVLEKQLEKLGVDADFVHDGKQAIKALKTGKYGLLITDLHMPEVDGYQLAAHIRKQEDGDGDQHFPIIVLTADVQMAQRETYLRHGFDECLLKPVSMGQFRRLLIRWGLLKEDSKPKKRSATRGLPDMPPSATSSAPPAPPAVDLEAMKIQMGAGDKEAIEMLGLFIEMTAPLIDKITAALQERDFRVLKETAHSLKGAARSACCNALGDAASHLQDEAEKGAQCDKIVEQVQAEFERAREAIQAL